MGFAVEVGWRSMAEAQITPVPRLVGKAGCILDHLPQANEAAFEDAVTELALQTNVSGSHPGPIWTALNS